MTLTHSCLIFPRFWSIFSFFCPSETKICWNRLLELFVNFVNSVGREHSQVYKMNKMNCTPVSPKKNWQSLFISYKDSFTILILWVLYTNHLCIIQLVCQHELSTGNPTSYKFNDFQFCLRHQINLMIFSFVWDT